MERKIPLPTPSLWSGGRSCLESPSEALGSSSWLVLLHAHHEIVPLEYLSCQGAHYLFAILIPWRRMLLFHLSSELLPFELCAQDPPSELCLRLYRATLPW